MTRILAVSSILMTLLVTEAAFAQVPDECSSAANTRAYRAGRMAGASLIRQTWNALDDCDRVEQFEDLVMSGLERYVPGSTPSTFTQCRFAGVVSGCLDELDYVYLGCVDSCFQEGQFAGEISAFAYCELSIALNGLDTADDFLRGPVQVCGFSFELGCDATFLSISESYENELGACLPFTEDTFVAVFEQARENQCAYNPIEPDASDSESADEERREP